MDDILKKIYATKKEEVALARHAMPEALLQEALAATDEPRGFANALMQSVANGRPAVIAEIKKASPAKGLLREDFRPAEIARAYEQAGASCLSILTDSQYFQGRAIDLQAARAACSLPVLRKDFIIDAYQLIESRAMGADCILLIVALDLPQLADLASEAAALGLDVLVEVHDEAELATALQLKDVLIGVNNRNLRTFQTDIAVSMRLRSAIEPSRLVISESGIASSEDIKILRAAGIDGFLIGEALMRQTDPGVALATLLEGTR